MAYGLVVTNTIKWCIDTEMTSFTFFLLKQIDSMVSCICSVFDHKGSEYLLRTSPHVQPEAYHLGDILKSSVRNY